MKKIYVCSPYRATAKRPKIREIQKKHNIELAKKACIMVIEHGGIPVAPHLYFTQFLDDNVKEEREMGMEMGLVLLKDCDELWAFSDHVISEGMSNEMSAAIMLDIPVRKFNTDGTEEMEHPTAKLGGESERQKTDNQ